MSDGHGGTDTGTVHVTITPVNDDPVAADDEVTVAQGASDVALSVLGNDDDVDGDTLTVTDAGAAAHGTTDVIGRRPDRTPRRPATRARMRSTTRCPTVPAGTRPPAWPSTSRPDADPPVLSQLRSAVATRRHRGLDGPGPALVARRGPGHGRRPLPAPAALGRRLGARSTCPARSRRPSSSSSTVGSTARFRIRATDGAGNRSAFTEWAPIEVRRPQERSAAIDWTGTWHETDDARFSGGHARHASGHSRRATFAFTGHAIGLVSRPSPNAGHADVRVDGVLVATIDLSASQTRYRRIVFRSLLATGGPHTIEIRPVGDGRVDIDAFIVLD